MIRLLKKRGIQDTRGGWKSNENKVDSKPSRQNRSKALEMPSKTEWVSPWLPSATDHVRWQLVDHLQNDAKSKWATSQQTLAFDERM